MTNLTSPQNVAPRRPLVAALLSTALPGLGQIYNGELNKGLWLFLGFALGGAVGGVFATLYAPSALMAPLFALVTLLALGIWLGSIVDAWRVARLGEPTPRRDWQVSGFYALLFLLGNAALYFGLVSGVNAHLVRSFTTPGASMTPSLLGGDYFLVDMRYNCPLCKEHVARGDVGVFVYPDDRTFYYVKRVIGLPGDHIALRGRELLVNGERVSSAAVGDGDRIVVAEQSGERKWRVEWMKDKSAPDVEWVIPPASVFVLGDNRDETKDSRSFGFVPLADLVGKARQIWFSKGPAGVRWERIGKTID
ncbi:signal peptidase I [Methylocystis heyeri]|uniref:Signal peptidase I n=1 Tax=Methylocystis heyeri TaxID=391905 RepID=A0A6B8KBF5_9HYPH|nr:signal peptidase I [Methylocystis heyeri]QGM45007.1 signal peptidase I [Methylocystis heyeri]